MLVRLILSNSGIYNLEKTNILDDQLVIESNFERKRFLNYFGWKKLLGQLVK